MLTKSKCRCCCLWSSRKVSLEESKNVNLELSREAIHFSNTSRKLLARAIVSSSKNWRNMSKAAVRWKERNELNDEQPLWPPHHHHCTPTAPLWRAPALYHKKNGVSVLYFLLTETSDGWLDGWMHLMKTCGVGYRQGPCTALGCHGNHCTCRIFSFAQIWPRRKEMPGGGTCPACDMTK